MGGGEYLLSTMSTREVDEKEMSRIPFTCFYIYALHKCNEENQQSIINKREGGGWGERESGKKMK